MRRRASKWEKKEDWREVERKEGDERPSWREEGEEGGDEREDWRKGEREGVKMKGSEGDGE